MTSGVEPAGGAGRTPTGSSLGGGGGGGSNLADVLERVLDMGIVVAGDIRVNLLDVELLTIKLRLIVAGVDTARRMGIDWWEHDPWLTEPDSDRRSLNERMDRVELALDREDLGPPLREFLAEVVKRRDVV